MTGMWSRRSGPEPEKIPPGDIRSWAEYAVSRIRPADEREAAKEELLAHYEDHVDALMERGLSKEKAQAEALQAMGDAEETGQLLKVAHSPWPNWVWQASRWLLVIAVITLIMVFGSEIKTAVMRYWNTENLKDTVSWFDEEDPYRTKRELPHDAKGRAGDYALSVYRAQEVFLEQPDGYTSHAINVILCAKGPVTLDSPYVLGEYMEARDSSGNAMINLFGKWDLQDPVPYVTGSVIGRKWNCHYISLYLYHYDPDAEWIDLTYDRGGVQFSMRLDLKGGGGT